MQAIEETSPSIGNLKSRQTSAFCARHAEIKSASIGATSGF
jgi:hypothetical protein